MGVVQCPQCGWSFDAEALRRQVCRMCDSALFVASLAALERVEAPAVRKYIAHYTARLAGQPDDAESILALALCYLHVGLYDLATASLDRLVATHPAEPAGYFYSAVATFRGRRPRLATLEDVRRALTLLDTAAALDPESGRADLVKAVVVVDYFVLNGLRPPEDPGALARAAGTRRLDRAEVLRLADLLRVGSGPAHQLILQIVHR